MNRTVKRGIFEVVTKRRLTGAVDEVLIAPAVMIIPVALVVDSDIVVDVVLTTEGETAESFVICWLQVKYR
jgi:hypothetical protein